MNQRFVLAALLAASLLQSIGCCWRHGCNKCNASPPPPPPGPVTYYAPPPPPCP